MYIVNNTVYNMAIELGALNRHDDMFLTCWSSVTTFGLKNKKNPFLVACNCQCPPPSLRGYVVIVQYQGRTNSHALSKYQEEDKLTCTQQVSGGGQTHVHSASIRRRTNSRALSKYQEEDKLTCTQQVSGGGQTHVHSASIRRRTNSRALSKYQEEDKLTCTQQVSGGGQTHVHSASIREDKLTCTQQVSGGGQTHVHSASIRGRTNSRALSNLIMPCSMKSSDSVR